MSVLDVDEVKRFLGGIKDEQNAEVVEVLDAAEAYIGDRAGYLSSTTVTERVNGARPQLVLRRCPVISLTSVTPSDGGAALDVDGLLVTPTGIVTEEAFMGFPYRYYTVVYQSGYATDAVPLDLQHAVKLQARILWKVKKGGAVRPTGDGGVPDEVTRDSLLRRFTYEAWV